MTTYDWLRKDSKGTWLIDVWAQPGAKNSEIVGVLDGCLKIRLAAPAVENKANQELLAFVARKLGLKASRLTLAKGEKNRRKTVAVADIAESAFSALAPDA